MDYWPFSDGVGADSFEDRWRKMAAGWTDDGVIALVLDEFEPYANASGAEIHVRAGRAALTGHYCEETVETDVPIAANAAGNPRIDRVVLEADLVALTVEFAVVQGTPAASPVAPSLTQSSSKWQIPIAQVAVANGFVSIAAGDVTDERQRRSADTVQLRVATADSTISSDASTNPDEELFVWLDANARYEFTCRIEYRGPTGGNFRYRFVGPTGAAGRHQSIGMKTGSDADDDLQIVTDDLSNSVDVGASGTGAGSWRMLVIHGWVTTGSDAGMLRFYWSQANSDGGNTIRRNGSSMRAERVA